ncbi:MAG: monothiol glutaredoxin, Grx4 family [Candidatus Muproteobacteria bacterium RBG_16_62_13]|uniref:Glutaredoxin n=1 Tax=Candidatus Muproteobacteria bacterium RBG_16_62_13 TaxID=1817756 RepID=A0A1F6T0W2_9PROT|nr:MAG: monothiol glutaredoxin, Grx4 family [Candidatus Muproteobacteria bacterium RBG_16_62_13]
MSIQDQIRDQLQSASVVLYMKGTPQMPQCGFSAKAVQLLNACGTRFATFNVLDNPDLRQGLKDFSNWPTFPQLYINGELVGGCDIMVELHQKGELQKLVEQARS